MDISKDERELYDRQIRLWGLEGQSRLRNSRILVLGFEAVAVEVVKNLCLAGVGSIILQSSKNVEENHLSHNFFLSADDIGRNIAEASTIAVQRLNPRVSVTAEQRSVQDIDTDYIKSHDVVIVTQLVNYDELSRINRGVRDADCAFFYCLLNGLGGFVFVDLGAKPHEFVVERELSSEEASSTEIGRVSATREIVNVKRPERASGSNTEKLTVKESYVSFDNAIKVAHRFGESMKPRQRMKVSPHLPAFLSQIESSGNVTKEAIYSKTEQLGLPKSIITDDFLSLVMRSERIQLSSMAAILGGILSQEVINVLTLREYPIQNTHIFDGLEGKGPLYFLSS